jgi:SAM-dependent methyltransferase
VSAWNEEYRQRGIPSSYRDAPSAAVTWALECWPRLGCTDRPERALDAGCGTARNAVYLAERGVRVTAFDSSPSAIDAARRRVRDAAVDVELLVRDLQSGLPAGDAQIDLVLDVFVYKHQTQPDARRRYRRELERVLTPGGVILLSLAEPDDGYYGSCPPLSETGAEPHAVVDPAVGVGSVLFSLGEPIDEMADLFTLEMAWRKHESGAMHGRDYHRRTLATQWRTGPN